MDDNQIYTCSNRDWCTKWSNVIEDNDPFGDICNLRFGVKYKHLPIQQRRHVRLDVSAPRICSWRCQYRLVPYANHMRQL